MLAEGTKLSQIRLDAKFVCEDVFVFAVVLSGCVFGFSGRFSV
jgi:hypothetical protein